MKLTVLDPWKRNKPLTIDDAELTRAVVMGVASRATEDRYALVFRDRNTRREFAITASGEEVAGLVQAICQAEPVSSTSRPK